MKTLRLPARIPLALLLIVMISGCSKLQPGYYLTPENYPGYGLTQTVTETPLPTDPPPTHTPTPESTIHVFATATPVAPPTYTATPLPTSTSAPCYDTEGTVIIDSFFSQITGNLFQYRIYLPPCYASANRRYPVLIMMHGLGEGMDDSQWERMGLTDAAGDGYMQGVLPPVIIVMPNGNDADHAGYYGPSPYPDVVVDELISLVDTRYCTLADPDYRAIGGLSRGGFWAYWIALNHPELFIRVGGHSPYFFEPESPTDKNPNNVVDTAPGIERLGMYFDHGPDDYAQVITGVQAFVQVLENRGIPSTYVINPTGDHTEAYWSAYVGDYLLFYTAGWPRTTDDLPTCEA